MSLRDLAHQRESEPHTFPGLARTRQAVERLEDALALRFRYARAVIGDSHQRPGRRAS